jgi:hypothetical protein
MNEVQTDYLRIDMGQNEFGQDYHIDLKIEQRRSERGFFRLYKLSHNGTGEYEVCDLQVVLTRGENGKYHLQDDITDKAIVLISLKYSATKLASSEDPAEINLNLPNDYYGTSLCQVYDNQVIQALFYTVLFWRFVTFFMRKREDRGALAARGQL